jgi:hypothetical protein
MAGDEVRSMNLVGAGTDSKEAMFKKNIVEMSLVGLIDHDISPGEVTGYEAGGDWMFYSVVGVVVAAAAMSFILSSIRKRPSKVSLSSMALPLVVVFNMFGVAAISQGLFNPGWILDNASLVGIFVVDVWLFVWTLVESRKTTSYQDVGVVKYIDVVFLLVGFVLLFTPYIGLGISLIVGIGIKKALSDPIYKKTLLKM